MPKDNIYIQYFYHKSMLIQNFLEVGSSETRKDALEIINAGIDAVLTRNAISKFVKLEGNILKIKDKEFDLSNFEKIYVIGGGKASADMAEEIEHILGDKIHRGIVTDVIEKKLNKIEVVKGTHPIPSEANAHACQRMVDIAQNASENDLIICLISGGGSALLSNPRAHVGGEIKMNEALMKAGANIQQMNAVRKHISKFKGGQLSKIAYPATIISLIFSDVLGNDLSVIASGPTVKDKTTLKDVKSIIENYGLPRLHPDDFAETPKEDKWFSKTHNILLLDNSVAVDAMKDKAQALGYQVEVLDHELAGEAREVGVNLAGRIKPGVASIAAGETTVTVTGDGIGGRNQELVLGAIEKIKIPGVVISAATDGMDNTDAAGAIADKKSVGKALVFGLNTQEYLQHNDAFHFFEKMKDLIITGSTGTNVADIMLALGAKN